MAVDTHKTFSPVRARRKNALEYRLIFGAAFLIFLPVALVARLLPGSRPLGSMHRRSVIAEAKAAAHRSAPFAFMG
ncbi:MAG: hypothetical protein NW215_04425 [Hyphomicrobiales bacterium]|nr:hypothetical protein [Hyphomicrobiales bacterium]